MKGSPERQGVREATPSRVLDQSLQRCQIGQIAMNSYRLA